MLTLEPWFPAKFKVLILPCALFHALIIVTELVATYMLSGLQDLGYRWTL
uniref:Uncharacterized protein n=1 Tax=Arundo donax TaxID=35708 RepID=A0A0A9GB66_ARUDO